MLANGTEKPTRMWCGRGAGSSLHVVLYSSRSYPLWSNTSIRWATVCRQVLGSVVPVADVVDFRPVFVDRRVEPVCSVAYPSEFGLGLVACEHSAALKDLR